ncbi:CLUMA_CG010923, isoform A [Clunio marinus]|uniref:CLUMA_CG010923, isoform A n=1 Tax=Clunio marinus TaxID=568069 RepID=A0A1J1IB67_9DIPT|nr:CLUMA_CG010923, isoform A [Clunio marinus]
MKFIIAVLCLVQIAFSAPNEPTFVEQAQQTLATVQQKATEAVADLNAKVLEATGLKSNQELLGSVQQQAETYATQIKGVAEKINEQVAAQKPQFEGFFTSITKQLIDSASSILGNEDPNKVQDLKRTFNNVLEQANALNSKITEQGNVASSALGETVGKLYQQTLESAKSLATQLDSSAATPAAPK